MPDAMLMPAPVSSSTAGWRCRNCASCSRAASSLEACRLAEGKFFMMRHANRKAWRRCKGGSLLQLHAETLQPRLPMVLNIGRDEDALGLADQQFTWHEAEIARVGAVVAVIAEHHEVVGRHRHGGKAARRARDLRQDLDAVLLGGVALADALRRQLAQVGDAFGRRVERRVPGWLAIDDQLFIAHFHRVTGPGEG